MYLKFTLSVSYVYDLNQGFPKFKSDTTKGVPEGRTVYEIGNQIGVAGQITEACGTPFGNS